MTNTITFFSCNTPEVQAFFSERYPDATFFPKDIQEYTKDQIPGRENITLISAFTASTWTPEHLSWFPNLKYLANRSTGYDNVDIEYCRQHDISVYNVPHYGSTTIAEHAFGLIYQFARRIRLSSKRVKDDLGFTASRGQPEVRGFDLSGKTLGVIGVGDIGENTIRIGSGFNMKIIAFDPNPREQLSMKYGVLWSNSIEKVLEDCDILSLHVPYNKRTHHLIGPDQAKHFKKGSILINTSRGEIVDTKTLAQLLETGTLSGAGLDVLEDEGNFNSNPQTEIQKLNHKLLGMDNVIITPHNAFNTYEAIGRIWKTTHENIQHALNTPDSPSAQKVSL